MVEVTENTGAVSFDKDSTPEAAWKMWVSIIYGGWITFDSYNAIYIGGKWVWSIV